MYQPADPEWRKVCTDVQFVLRSPTILAACQGGFVVSLVSAVAWGVALLWCLEAERFSLASVANIVAAFQLPKGLAALLAGCFSERCRHKVMLLAGMVAILVGMLMCFGAGSAPRVFKDNAAIEPTLQQGSFGVVLAGFVLLGAGSGTTLPLFELVVVDFCLPGRRAPTLGLYRMWRDFGYAVGGLLSGLVMELPGSSSRNFTIVAAITAALACCSFLQVLRCLTGTLFLPRQVHTTLDLDTGLLT
jgi:MFS family permease